MMHYLDEKNFHNFVSFYSSNMKYIDCSHWNFSDIGSMFNFIFVIRTQIDPWANNSFAKKTHYKFIWGVE